MTAIFPVSEPDAQGDHIILARLGCGTNIHFDKLSIFDNRRRHSWRRENCASESHKWWSDMVNSQYFGSLNHIASEMGILFVGPEPRHIRDIWRQPRQLSDGCSNRRFLCISNSNRPSEQHPDPRAGRVPLWRLLEARPAVRNNCGCRQRAVAAACLAFVTLRDTRFRGAIKAETLTTGFASMPISDDCVASSPTNHRLSFCKASQMAVNINRVIPSTAAVSSSYWRTDYTKRCAPRVLHNGPFK